MPENRTLPQLEDSQILLEQLLDEVQKWEGTLSGGNKTNLGVEAVNNLLQTKVRFGNPFDNLFHLTPESFAEQGIQLSKIRQQQMAEQFNFYYMTLNVNIWPGSGTVFNALSCELDLGPKGLDEPIIQAIFPKSEWRSVLNWGGGMSLGLNGNLEWNAGIDDTLSSQMAELPQAIKLQVSNRNKMHAFIVVPNYFYEAGRFEIAAAGEGDSACYWHIDKPEFQKTLTVQFGIIFKVPKHVKEITLNGIVWVEPGMSWLAANVRHVLGDLQNRFKALFRKKEAAAKHFARGDAEKWTIPLPQS